MKTIITLILLMASTSASSTALKACEDTLLYFDLGNTLVNTKDHPYEVRYMDGAKKYIDSLVAAKCTIGLIVNIPESFGTTYAQKIKTLKEYVDTRWQEEKPFPWDYFFEIHVPFNNEDLKPKPILFRQVHLNAWEKGNHVLYQGETPAEITAARAVGMSSFLVGSRGDSFYLPLNEIPTSLCKE